MSDKNTHIMCVSQFNNNSSAVAEMGDHLATIGMAKSGEGLLWEAVSPSNTGLGRGLPLYQVAS